MLLTILLLLGAEGLDARLRNEFEIWKTTWNRSYNSTAEEQYRFLVFSENYDTINRLNSLNRTHTLAVNVFADITTHEFMTKHNNNIYGYLQKNGSYYNQPITTISTNLPTAVDWTMKGAVTPVKNQGQCGSCWAFSTTGSVEGAWFINSSQLVSLSEQQLIDCSGPEGNQGCNGGIMDNAFQYIINNGGICEETAYPYTGTDGACKKCTPNVHISSFVDVAPNNTLALMTAVAQQPVSVAVEADGLDWQFYFGGVVTDSCGLNLDHGVLVVGYGTDPTSGDYWKVKNSWGAGWGEQGYIRLGRGSNFSSAGECGILMFPSYSVV